MKKIFSTILFTLIFLSITSQAHAYLDPGTGSMVLQIVIAGLVGALFFLKGFWARIKGFFSAIFSKKKD